MNDLIFTIDAETRKATASKTFMGITGENLQDNLIFDFKNEFIDGVGILELESNGNKYIYGMQKIQNRYVVPIQSSMLAYKGKAKTQLKVVNESTGAIFKSRIFEIPVLEAISATDPAPAGNLQDKTVTPTTTEQEITADTGYSGLGTVTVEAVTSEIDANIEAGNIKKDVSILGVTGTYTGGTEEIGALIDGTITSVTSDVQTIKYAAFYGCTSLTSVNLPNVISINVMAFNGCTSLTNVNLPSATTIGTQDSQLLGVFNGCTSLTNIYLPSATIIYDDAFRNCSNLTNAIFDNLTEMRTYVFRSCTSLTDITIGTNSVCQIYSNSIPASATHHITIHVPSNLIASYQTATNWATLYNNGYIDFVAIE